MGLHIGVFGAEELLHAVYGKLLHLVNNLTAAVIAVSGITFGIFVGETRAHGAHHFFADEVFGSNQFYAFFLALILTVN